MKAIITVGIPGSGKTTWANEQKGFVNLNRDDIRKEIFQFENYSDYKFTKPNEKRVTEYMRDLIERITKDKRDIIISDTHLYAPGRVAFADFLEDLGYEVEYKLFDISFWDAVKRDEKRQEKTVGRQIIYRMYLNYLEYIGRKTYTPDTSLPSAYMFDIDGTLASHKYPNGKNIRSPFEWNRVGEDFPIQPTIDILNLLAKDNNIFLLSGRDGSCRAETKKWLDEQGIGYDWLYMREPDDNRKDSIIKEELFWEHVAPFANVKAVFDDRPQVCLLWNELKVPLFKVGDSVIEF